MSTTSNTLFTGTSRYSSDFQNLINRAVAIASLPLTQLSGQKTQLEDQSKALAGLDQKFTAIQTAIENLETALGSSSYSVSVSSGSVLSASLSAGATAANYSVQVDGLGSYASTLSTAGVADPSQQNIASGTSLTLTVDSTPHTLTLQSATLNGLVDAINAAGLDVRATLVNLGTTAVPEYHLSVQGTKLAAMTIQLETDLLEELAGGGNATYRLSGMTETIATDSRTVTLAPGVGLTLLGTGTSNVTVSRTATGVSNALSTLVTAYNAAVDALDAQRGEDAGALSGQSIVFTLTDALRSLAGYSAGSGTFTMLSELGISLDRDGKLSFDATAFSSATAGNLAALETFLGGSSSGGFLKAAGDVLDSLEDSTNGILKSTISGLSSQLTAQAELIETQQERVDQYQQALIEQMNKADALIASLEQQATYMTNLFESMRIASEMYK